MRRRSSHKLGPDWPWDKRKRNIWDYSCQDSRTHPHMLGKMVRKNLEDLIWMVTTAFLEKRMCVPAWKMEEGCTFSSQRHCLDLRQTGSGCRFVHQKQELVRIRTQWTVCQAAGMGILCASGPAGFFLDLDASIGAWHILENREPGLRVQRPRRHLGIVSQKKPVGEQLCSMWGKQAKTSHWW